MAHSQDPPEEPGILRRGLYYEQVRRYMMFFGAENVLVVGSGELANAPVETTWKVAKHARPDTPRPEFAWLEKRHVRQYEKPMSAVTRNKLSEFYSESNHKLSILLGRELHW